MTDDIYPLIKEFSEFIKQKIDEALKNNEIKEQVIEQPGFKWKLDNFEYSLEKGIFPSGAIGEPISIKQSVFIHNIVDNVKESSQYKMIIEKLPKLIALPNMDGAVQVFINNLIQYYLRYRFISEDLLQNFVRDIKNEPFKMKAVIELISITLEPDKIQVSPEILIRRPIREDLEDLQ